MSFPRKRESPLTFKSASLSRGWCFFVVILEDLFILRSEMINLLKLLLWTFALLLLVGCSMRPLSAGAFMEAYQSVNDSSKTVVGVSVTGMRGGYFKLGKSENGFYR